MPAVLLKSSDKLSKLKENPRVFLAASLSLALPLLTFGVS